MNQRVKRAIAAAMSLTMVATATPVSPLYNAIQNAVSSAMIQANAGTIEEFNPRVLSVSLYDDADNVQSIEMLYDWPFPTTAESPVHHCVVLTDRKISYTGQLVETYKKNDTDINDNFKRIMWINNEDGSTYSNTTDPILSITASRKVTSIMNDVETIFNFDKGVLSADDENKELYIYLWTKNPTGYWYPDFQFATLKVDDGKIYYGQSENSPTNLLQFSIQKAALSQSTFYYLKGETNKPAVMYRGKQLIEGTDYTVTGTSSAEDIGEYSMTINGIGAYTGSKTFTWKVSVNEINTIEDLEALAASVNAGRTFEGETIVLNADIAEALTTPIGTKEHPFKGTFDGNGKTIKLNINMPNDYYVGLFGYAENATIKNVTVNGEVLAEDYAGCICGYLKNSTLNNCISNAKIGNGPYASEGGFGGICGCAVDESVIINCVNTGEVVNNWSAGGVCGWVYNKSKMYNCYNTGTVSGEFVGGITCSVSNYSILNNCYNIGGSNICDGAPENSTISNCYLLDENDEFDAVTGVTEITAAQLAGTAPLDATSGIMLVKELNNNVMNYNNATPAPAIPFMYWKNDAASGRPVLTEKMPLENAGLTLAENSVIYSNSDFKPTVKLGNDTITSGTDFTIAYQKKGVNGEYATVTSFDSAGTYKVIITATDDNNEYFGTLEKEITVLAKGDFSNVTDHNIKVDGAELPTGNVLGFEANKEYVITSDAELKFDGFKGNVLGNDKNSSENGYIYTIVPTNEDTEFSLSYTPKYNYTNDKDQIKYQCTNNKNDTDVKTFATLIMTDGKDEIENKTIEYGTNYDFAITLDNEEITPQKISFMKYDSEDVKQPCGKPENVGKYFVQADEKFGDATYPLSFDFDIEAKNIADQDVAKSVTDITYDGQTHTPSATVTYKGKTLLEGEDYTVNITDKINAGTYDVIITGIGNYTGSTTLEWNIDKADMTDQDVTKSVKDITYDGEKHTPSATVKYKGKTLVEGVDYTVNITDEINAATYEVIITGIGNYKGSTTLEWNIDKADMTDFKFKNSAPYVKTYDAEAVDVSTKNMSTDADFGIENYPVGTTFEYSYSVKDASGNLTPIQGEPVDAGNYIVSIMPVNPNYNCYSITKDITIKKAEVTLTPESKSVTYGKAKNEDLAIKYEIKNETAIPDADKSLFSDNAVSQFLFAENYDAKKGVVNSYNILLDTASLETYDKNKDNLADYRNFAVSTESGKQITVNPISLTDKAIEIVFIDDGKKGEYEYTGNYYSLYGKINVIYKENVWGENELKEITDFVLRGNVQKYAMGDYLVQVDALSIDSPTLTGRKAVAWSIGMNKTVDFVSNSNITYGEELVCDIMPKLIDKDVNVVYNYYNADTDEKLAAAPTDAGKYYVIADVTNKSGETATYKDTFEISKKKLYFEAIDYEITYKDALPNIADVVKFYSDSEGEESVTLTDEEIAELIDFSDEFKQTTFNVGEYNYGFKSGSGHKNYEWNSVYITNSDGKLKVNPKQITEDMFVFADKAFVLDPNIGVATIKYELNDITEDDYIAFEDVTAYAPGKYTVEFRGKGNYTGNVRVNWNVAAKCSYSHSITMNNNMTLNYYISHSDIQKFENVRLEVTNTATGVKKELKGELKIWDQSYGYEYRFEYTGIAAKEIGANIEAVLVAEKDGVEYHFNEDVYSIKNYCYIQLAKPTNTEKDQLLKTMLVDLLNYGSEAQKYFKYDTDNLANAALTAEQKAWGTSETPDVKSCEETIKLAGATASISGKSLVFGNSVDLKFYMNLQNVKNTDNVKLRISYTNSHNKPVTKYFDFDDFGFSHDEKYGDEYTISYNGLNAADFSVPINVTIMDGEKEISDTIVYSIESYAKKFIGKNEISDVLIEMMKYSKSADAYLNK